MFNKILIANRGEIACRIMRTAQRLGIKCVAVYSTADARALHVQLADEAYLLGAAASQTSYLNSEKILQIAQAAAVEAIHPGYGFLAENADFAETCSKAGLHFIGPPPYVMRLMGLKNAAKERMQQAGIPVVPGYQGDAQDLEILSQAADKIGYPLLIKAAAGGGGKGMRLVQQAAEFAEALAAAQREAKASFNDERILLEKYLVKPRHIEVQIMADQHGQVIHLFERDCSIQRRYQKIIEETPAPHLPPAVREEICAAAVAGAQAVGYINAGTMEFLVDQDQQFYFMEMNTRLQVEHPITEMISGQDLLEWQLRIACGEPLPLTQAQLTAYGHAFEVRICAEDPQRHFLPATGKIIYLKTPALQSQLRLDTGVVQGDTISVYYDSLVAKLVVWDHTREAALQRLQQALRHYHIVGVTTNLALLQAIACHPAFAAGQVNTFFLEEFADALLTVPETVTAEIIILASLFVLLTRQPSEVLTTQWTQDLSSPWQYHDAWRLNAPAQHTLRFHTTTQAITVCVTYQSATQFVLQWQNKRYTVTGSLIRENVLAAVIDGVALSATVIAHKKALHIFYAEQQGVLQLGALPVSQHQHEELAASLTAPMPGVVAAVMVAAGQRVVRGTSLLVIEAMKMEHTLYASADGVVAALHCQAGDAVQEGTELLVLDTATNRQVA